MDRLYMYQNHRKTSSHEYKVCDSKGQCQYVLKGRLGRIEDRLILYDSHGQERYRVVQVVLSFLPKFELTAEGEFIGNVTKHINFEHHYYSISQLDWCVLGDFESQEYRIVAGQTKLAHIKKTISGQGVVYLVDCLKAEYKDLYCLLAVLVDHYSLDASGKEKDQRDKDSTTYSPLLQHYKLKEQKKLQK